MLGPLLAFVSFASLLACALAGERGPALIRAILPLRLPLALAGLALALARPRPGRVLLTLFFVLLGRAMHPDRIFKAIDDPQVLPADAAQLGPDEKVVGVELEGAVRAYRLDTVARHHLINDVLNGQPALVSYCPLCKSGVAYDARVDGERLRFRVAGFWRRNMVMRDLATSTIWQQSTGHGEAGPYAGRDLTMLPAELTTWAAWRADHPQTTAVVEPPHDVFDYRWFVPMKRLFALGAGRVTVARGRHPPDGRLPAREEVAGLSLDGETRAYPLAVLARTGAVEDELGGRRVRLQYDTAADRVRAYRDGAPLPVKRELWISWSEFNPGTGIYSERSPAGSARGRRKARRSSP